ncbi:hypothetical protein QUB70_02005 [Microcoleus sp. A003_D6]|uniref:hypothetical protein n=1 Tax=Microcoleus sp. A003_D6 TaxID=3055266 RepID=UPI002FD27C3A
MPVIETSIHKAFGFSTYFFHTLIKQYQIQLRQFREMLGKSLNLQALMDNNLYKTTNKTHCSKVTKVELTEMYNHKKKPNRIGKIPMQLLKQFSEAFAPIDTFQREVVIAAALIVVIVTIVAIFK